MVARTGLFVKPIPTTPAQGTSPTDGRLVFGGLFGTTGGCIAGGVFTASATQMQVTVSASVWRIPDPTNSAAVFLSPADTNIFTFSAGPASGSRIDLLWVKQNNYENSDADSRVTYGVTAGVASATPVAPSLPAGAMLVGTLTVPTGVSNAAACTLVPAFKAPAGALFAVTPAQRCSLVKTTSQTVVGNTNVDVTFDTVASDPTGVMAPLDGKSIRCPWAGRYRVRFTFAVSTSVIAATVAVGSLVVLNTSGADTVVQFTGQGGSLLDVPITHVSEVTVPAGATLRSQVYWGDSTSRNLSFGSQERYTKLDVQYLGPV